MENQNILTLRDVSCGYGQKKVLEGINISLRIGEFAGIIGCNGVGKTTLFKTILRELPLLQGEIKLRQHELSSLSVRQLAKQIAVVNQNQVISHISVQEYVLMGRLPYLKTFSMGYSNRDKEIAQYYIELAGIEHLRHRMFSELSGGEQQLAAIAMALTQEPRLLLLDEPTSHLDIAYQAAIMNLLKSLNQSLQLTILMILHDLNMASEYCSLLILTGRGEIVAQGSPKQVLTEELLCSVYGIRLRVSVNPFTGQPTVFPYLP